ncbi:hypothetical protein DPMN_084652 [Dreissena polymorpha]|uniref:Reverse transcriptase n=1 Tax=Dreissena polymorpha TaxID=45954 RepID=A0A9D4BL32_DREPO|nr:hypothetical protein DPMN_084652 [Dreissena polymorpha]
MTCRIVHNRQLTGAFEVRTGVRQGCLLLHILFLLAIDIGGAEAEWHSVDSLETVGRPRLCR